MERANHYTLGINNSSHDTSAAILKDGRILAFSSQERFDRIKHSGNFPMDAIDFCLRETGLTENINAISEISFGFNWAARAKDRFELLSPGATDEQRAMLLNDNKLYEFRENRARKIFREHYGYSRNIVFHDHYDCHASASYFSSPFKRSAILVLDGAGERASARIYKAEGSSLEILFQIDFPNSLGRFYSAVTDHLGFKVDNDEGKVMGLAPFGTPTVLPQMRKFLGSQADGRYIFNTKTLALFDGNRKGFSGDFSKIFGPKRIQEGPISQHHKDIAWAAQTVLEEAMLGMVALVKKHAPGFDSLCLGGGVVLNSVANGKLLRSGLFKDIYMHPASADDGTALGAAYKSYFATQKEKMFFEGNQSPYFGYCTNSKEIERTLLEFNVFYKRYENIHEKVSELLAQNKIVAWFSGRAEVGPRALGNRSIIANPSFADNKDIVNSKIKFREFFRPFAPSILEEYANDYFEMDGATSPYMLLTFNVRENKRTKIPAVTHVDATARVQTVNQNQNPSYRKLLSAFHARTGLPVLLNTSFNRNMEPIVNTPEDAVKAFLGSGLEYMAIENYLVWK